MNVTLKNIPDHIYRRLKDYADEQGRSLNAQVLEILSGEALEVERRRKMRESRASLERFVASLPVLDDSSELIREDRER
ncbi:MAG: FitA-like ribbon-helix-helix domain-containing protein [Bryobacteraceae bacterium]